MDGQSQIFLPRLTLINKIIVIISSVIFVLGFFKLPFMAYLSFTPNSIGEGKVWTMLTYPLVSMGLIEQILNCLMLWLMGSEFESNWGRSRYIKFLICVVLGGALVYGALGFFMGGSSMAHLNGLSGIVSSLCVAYAVIYPKRIFSFMMVIPIEAKYFCWILALISLFQGIGASYLPAFGHLGSILFGFLFMYIVSHKNFKALSSKMEQLSKMEAKRKKPSHLKIVKNDDDEKPKYWH